MRTRNAKELSDELSRLRLEQLNTLKKQNLAGLSEEEFRQQWGRLERIHELSADLLVAFKRNEL